MLDAIKSAKSVDSWKNQFSKLSLLPKEPIESFWDALWLGIRPFLCFMVQKSIL